MNSLLNIAGAGERAGQDAREIGRCPAPEHGQMPQTMG